jgi:hypothetical protein
MRELFICDDSFSKDAGWQVLEIEVNSPLGAPGVFSFRDLTGKNFAISHAFLPFWHWLLG